MKRPALYIAVFICLGIVLSRHINIPVAYPWLLSAAFISITILSLRRAHLSVPYVSEANRNRLSHAALYLAVFFFAIAYYQNAARLPAGHISNFTPDDPVKVFLKGTVEDDPVYATTVFKAEKTSFTFKVDAMKDENRRGGLNLPYGFHDDDWRKVSGLIMVNSFLDKRMPVSAGDCLILEGYLSRVQSLKNPGVFDYSEYLAVKNIYSVLRVKENCLMVKGVRPCQGIPALGLTPFVDTLQKTAYKVRHFIRDSLDRFLDEPYRGFTKAILIGDRTSLSKGLREEFVYTGTVHILAISGLHVGIIAGIILYVFWMLKIPRKAALGLAVMFLAVYSLTAGASPPIIRAVIIFTIFAAGYLIDRKADMLNSLSAAAILILLWNPKELFDPSFQLSFASVAGIIVLTPKIEAILGMGRVKAAHSSSKFLGYMIKCVSVSIAAWLGTWPFIAEYFNMISPVSIIANLIVIPLLSVVMASSFLFLALSFFQWASVLSAGLCLIEQALFSCNSFLAQMPLAYFRIGSPSAGFTLLYYALLSLLLIPEYIILANRRVYKKIILLAVLVLLNIVVWKDIIASRADRMKITFLDVGQGDSALIELPKKGAILIDGGPGGKEEMFDAGKSVVAPVLWNKGIRRLDAVVVTHFHEDHLGGLLYVLNNFKVGCVIDNGAVAKDSLVYNEYIRVLKKMGIRRIIAGRPDMMESVNGVKIFVLNPGKEAGLSDTNDNSLVLKVVYRNFSVLFCGDITADAMKELLPRDDLLRSDVMKVPHHGGGLGDEIVVKNFFDAVAPRVTVISAGRTGRYKMPSGKITDIITSLNAICYVTKTDGAVEFSVDEKSRKINTCENK